MQLRGLLLLCLCLLITFGSAGKIDRVETTKKKGGGATTKPPDTPTKIQFTTTLPGGGTKVIDTEYKQKFVTTYNTPTHSPSKGSIGLGTIKGKIGVKKPEKYVTITK